MDLDTQVQVALAEVGKTEAQLAEQRDRAQVLLIMEWLRERKRGQWYRVNNQYRYSK